MGFLPTYSLQVETSDSEHVTIAPPLTIEFEISRKWLMSANTCFLRIYNLAEATRNRLYKDLYQTTVYRALQFRAGYPDYPLPLVFNGNVLHCYSYRQGVNFITEIEGQDGQIAMVNGFTSKTIAAGASAGDILKALIADLPNTAGSAIIGTFEQVNARGEALSGNTWKLISDKSGNCAVIDNGQVKILNDSEAITGEIPELSSASGLLGSPVRTDTMIQVSLIFEPRLTLGQKVHLSSTTNPIFDRDYKVMGIEHSGTISPAVDGERRTTAWLYFGAQALKMIAGTPIQ
jgi:hypothetical protein